MPLGFEWMADAHIWWAGLVKPLLRLVFFLSVSLLAANIIEALNWTRGVARVAAPLVQLGHLRDVSGAAFSLAFVSSIAANTMLAESHEKGELSRRELVFANIFNSMPAYFVHLPSMGMLVVSVLGGVGAVYVGLTLAAAVLRTLSVIVFGRIFLPPVPEGCVSCRLEEYRPATWGEAVQRSLQRFRRRMPRILYITVPVYCCVFVLQRSGGFAVVERFMQDHVTFLAFLEPQTLSVVILHIAAEFTPAISAAGALLDSGTIAWREIVLALLAGNVLSTPMRAFRHQFPSYAGIFKPRLALHLIVINQCLRAGSIVAVGVLFFYATL
ncbi:Nucleoside recognition domain protein [Oleidesulfovibrio alaskensis]